MYTKGEWKLTGTTVLVDGDYRRVVAHVTDPDKPLHTTPIAEANAQLIASAPIMHGQLETGIKALAEARTIIVEVAKTMSCTITCPPGIAEQMCALQAYVSGVIAGNELALAKAGG